MPFGSEMALTPGLSSFERLYIKLFGAPVLGLRVRARTILPLLDGVTGLTDIVDVGSGRGMMTLACARRFPDAKVLGIDLSERLVAGGNAIVHQLGVPNLEFRVFDAMNLQDLGGFDLVISTDMLEHLEDDLSGVAMFKRAMRPGGRLLVHVPHLTRNTFGWRRENCMDIEGHVRPGYTREGLIELLTRGGLKVEKCVYNYNWLETLANDLSKVITGGRERNRHLYALCFPLLMAIAWLGSLYRPRRDGSGLVALARRED